MKDNYGINIGDKVRFRFRDEDGKLYKGSGIVDEIDYDSCESKDYPTFYIMTQKTIVFYFGPNLIKL